MKGDNISNIGRKKTDNHRVTLSVRVKKETKSILTDHAKNNDTSVGRIIDQLAETI